MDSKDLALYYEEQRQALIDLNKGITELHDILKQDKIAQVKLAEQPIVSVSNQRDSITVSNIAEVEKSLEKLSKTLENAIKNNSYKPKDEIKVTNQPKDLKINNLSDLKAYFDDITQTIKDNQPIVQVTKQDIVWPTAPSQAIPVRLSDGKSFYKAIMTAVAGGGSNPTSRSINTNQVSISSTATKIVDGNNTRKCVTIINNGTTAVYIGNDSVTTSTGLLLIGTAGAAITIESTATVYGIVSSTSQTVSYLEEIY